MSPSDWIAVIGIVATVIIAVLGYVLSQKNKRIEILETKNELQEKTISKQELQILELRIVGSGLNKLFRQLPTGEETDKESP